MKDTARESDDDFDDEPVNLQPNIEHFKPKKSKWTDFVEKSRETPTAEPSDSIFLNTEVVLEVPKKVRNLGKRNNFKCPSLSKPPNNNEDYMENNRESSAKKEMDSYRPYGSFQFSGQLCETNGNANLIMSSESIPIKTETTKHQMDKEAPKKLVTPVVNNSKWAQFVETEVEPEDQDDFNDTTGETIESVNNDNYSKDNGTEDSELDEKYHFYMKNDKQSLFKNSYIFRKESEMEKSNLSGSFVPTVVKESFKWASLVETDKNSNKSTFEIANVHGHTQNPITSNTLFALCEDSELDEILDI